VNANNVFSYKNGERERESAERIKWINLAFYAKEEDTLKAPFDLLASVKLWITGELMLSKRQITKRHGQTRSKPARSSVELRCLK
jgi:hypothetical protein